MSNIAIVENKKIKKSNLLVNAKYDLSLSEQRVITMAIAYIEDEENRTVEVPIQDYRELLGIEYINSTHFDEVLKKLRQNTIVMCKINKKTGEVEEGLITGWVDRIKYKNATISITFNEDIWEYLVNLKEKYTQLELKNILKLQSKYSFRLYEILKSVEYLGNYTIKIDDFREIMFIGNKYSRFNDFTDKILQPSIEEINNVKDIYVSYKGVKRGNKYDSLRFTIVKKNEGIESAIPQVVQMARSMDKFQLFTNIKSLLMIKYSCMFTSSDKLWEKPDEYTKHALESTYIGLMSDEWKEHNILNHKAFFAEHIKRLSA